MLWANSTPCFFSISLMCSPDNLSPSASVSSSRILNFDRICLSCSRRLVSWVSWRTPTILRSEVPENLWWRLIKSLASLWAPPWLFCCCFFSFYKKKLLFLLILNLWQCCDVCRLFDSEHHVTVFVCVSYVFFVTISIVLSIDRDYACRQFVTRFFCFLSNDNQLLSQNVWLLKLQAAAFLSFCLRCTIDNDVCWWVLFIINGLRSQFDLFVKFQDHWSFVSILYIMYGRETPLRCHQTITMPVWVPGIYTVSEYVSISRSVMFFCIFLAFFLIIYLKTNVCKHGWNSQW